MPEAAKLTDDELATDWYALLEVAPEANEDDINRSYKKLALRYHPDRNRGNAEAAQHFIKIKEASLLLLDGPKRRLYDERRIARLRIAEQNAARDRSMGDARKRMRDELESREAAAAAGPGEAALATAQRRANLDRLKKEGTRRREAAAAAAAAASEQRLAEAAARRTEAAAAMAAANAEADEAAVAAVARRARPAMAADNGGKPAAAAAGAAAAGAAIAAAAAGMTTTGTDLSDRQVKVKWSRKKAAHTNTSLAALFGRYGAVQSVRVVGDKGNTAVLTFAAPSAAEAAAAAFADGDVLRTRWADPGRRSRDAPAEIAGMAARGPAGTGDGGGAGNGFECESAAAAGGGATSRDLEDLMMMRMRQAAERQRVIDAMKVEESSAGAGSNGGSGKGTVNGSSGRGDGSADDESGEMSDGVSTGAGTTGAIPAGRDGPGAASSMAAAADGAAVTPRRPPIFAAGAGAARGQNPFSGEATGPAGVAAGSSSIGGACPFSSSRKGGATDGLAFSTGAPLSSPPPSWSSSFSKGMLDEGDIMTRLRRAAARQKVSTGASGAAADAAAAVHADGATPMVDG